MADPMTPWAERPFDAFGRIVVTPDRLTPDDRVIALRRAAGDLLAHPDAAVQWIGRALLDWLATGQRFDQVVGLVPPQGSHRTVARRARQRAADEALLALATEAGSDALALRFLRGEAECPMALTALLGAALAAGASTGPNAVSRARRRLTT